jgi:hypothetical protein
MVSQLSLDELFVAAKLYTTPSVRDRCLFDRNGNPSGDHFALFTSLEISKPPKQHNTVSYRKFSEINTTDLIQDLNTSKIVQNREGLVVNVVKLYNSELSSIIDKHAPLELKNIILRPNTAPVISNSSGMTTSRSRNSDHSSKNVVFFNLFVRDGGGR